MLVLPLLLACGLFEEPDPAEVEARLGPHHQALLERMPPVDADCDGVDRLIAGEDPRGCRFRPTRDVAEISQVTRRCSGSRGTHDAETVLWQAAYGMWTASPPAIVTCASRLVSVSKEIVPQVQHERPPMPDLEVVAYGARWHAGVAALSAPDQPALIRGWLEVERRLAGCGPIDGPDCARILASHGVEDQRVSLESLGDALATARAALDAIDRKHRFKPR